MTHFQSSHHICLMYQVILQQKILPLSVFVIFLRCSSYPVYILIGNIQEAIKRDRKEAFLL